MGNFFGKTVVIDDTLQNLLIVDDWLSDIPEGWHVRGYQRRFVKFAQKYRVQKLRNTNELSLTMDMFICPATGKTKNWIKTFGQTSYWPKNVVLFFIIPKLGNRLTVWINRKILFLELLEKWGIKKSNSCAIFASTQYLYFLIFHKFESCYGLSIVCPC